MSITGSEIAKGGFANEKEVADKFNNWRTDKDAQAWLKIMMYDLNEIVSVHAKKIGSKGFKSDVNVTINVTVTRKNKDVNIQCVENIQIKLVSTKSGFNQVEKRKVYQYAEKWHMPDEVVQLLEYYDGERLPYAADLRDNRRMFIDEFSAEQQKIILDYFQKHIVMIVSDVIRGRGRFAAEWTLVVNKHAGYRWVLVSINEAIGIYLGDCKVTLTTKGNIKLGNISLQRKGGDNGADTANMLQFKADPMILFTEETLKYSSDVIKKHNNVL